MEDPKITTVPVVVRSTDVDGDQNVNNAVFFQYFEEARLEHLIRLGVISADPVPPPGEPARAFAIAETRCRFLARAFWRDRLLVTARTTRVGNRSFDQAYEITREGDGARIAEGDAALVWLDAEGRPAPLPPSVREALVDSLAGERASG